MLKNIPYLGSGLGYRPEIAKQISANRDKIDFVEIVTENYIGSSKAFTELAAIRDSFKVIPHGVGLSIGTPVLDKGHLLKIKQACGIIDAPYYSEHMCMTKVPGLDSGHLAPLWFTNKTLEVVINNVNELQNYLGIPLILENITYKVKIPNGTMSQEDFFGKVIEATGCGILLDVTNVHTNAYNHDWDPFEFIDNMPLDNIVQLHTAGGFYTKDQAELVDSHSAKVEEKTWKLLEYVHKKASIRGVLLEHDNNFPEDFEVLLKQVERARKVLNT